MFLFIIIQLPLINTRNLSWFWPIKSSNVSWLQFISVFCLCHHFLCFRGKRLYSFCNGLGLMMSYFLQAPNLNHININSNLTTIWYLGKKGGAGFDFCWFTYHFYLLLHMLATSRSFVTRTFFFYLFELKDIHFHDASSMHTYFHLLPGPDTDL